MTLLICRGCTTAYSVGAPRCPQCQSTEFVEEGAEDMPKITVHGGASNEHGHVGEHGPELVSLNGDEDKGSEGVSVGSSSETSSEKPSASPKKSGTARQKPARATGSPSATDQTGSSTARSTGGDQTEATSGGDA